MTSKTKPKKAQAKPAVKPAEGFNFVPAKSSQVIARANTDGSVAIIRLDSDQYFFVLDGISAEVWSMIDGKKSMNQIVTTMIEKRDLPAARFTKDVKKLVSDLRKEKLIT